MMRLKVRLRCAAVLAAMAATMFLSPGGAQASGGIRGSASTSASAGKPISLVGEGSDDLAKEMPAWANELYGARGGLSVSYSVVGGLEGRADYILGIGDFVVSGLPWQPSELSQLPAATGGVISAPIEVSAVGFGLAWGPQYILNRSCSPSGHSCTASSTYSGPLDIPSTSLVDMMWHATATNSPATCGCLSDPAILAATAGQLPQGTDTADPTLSAGIVRPVVALVRSEPSETSYYLQDFAARAAPAEFAKIPFFKPPISEYLQGEQNGGFTQTQQGVQSEIDFMTNEAGGVIADNPQGIIAPLPPSGLTRASYYLPPGLTFSGSPPAYPPAWIGVENASGQFVTPTPATIDAAVNAGGATPLYGLSNRVPGSVPAYPLTYVDSLSAPAHGLSADHAEAIATIIRYGATAGQDAMPPQNDGTLPPSLVQQALAAANQLIASNCTATNEQVVVSDSIGRFPPRLGPLDGKSAGQRQAELAAIGPMLHCDNVAVSGTPPPGHHGSRPPATTLPPHTVSTSSSGAQPASSASASGSAGSGSTSAGSGGANAVGAAPTITTQPKSNSPPSSPTGATKPNGPVTLLGLPLGLPGTGIGEYNRLVGMVLGGLAFLLLWRGRGLLSRAFRP